MSDEILRIGIASSDDIRSWSSGRIWTPTLLNRDRRRPAAGGLFCEGIFGLVRDRDARRQRMGHIELAAPVVHTWFWNHEASVLGRMLTLSQNDLKAVVHCQCYLVIDPGPTPLRKGQLLSEAEYPSTCREFGETFEAETGGRAIQRLLERRTLPSGDPATHLVLDCIPVIPPALRPLRQGRTGQVIAGDLNELYQRILNRDRRLRKLYELNAPPVIIRNEIRMLQESVDALFDNRRVRRPVRGRGNRRLRSLTDRVERRLKRDLVRKRADYSGRARVIVDPGLGPHQCGLPRSLVEVLYRPFLQHASQALRNRPVLLNLRAFDSVPVEDEVIHLHPLALSSLGVECGDVVSVHLPLSNQARAEASLLLRPTDTGMAPPTLRREAILGCYHLTTGRDERASIRFTGTPAQVIAAHEHGRLGIHDPVHVQFLPRTERVRTTVGRVLFQAMLPEGTPFPNQPMTSPNLAPLLAGCTPAQVVEIQRVGFRIATQAGLSIGLGDLRPPSNKVQVEAEARRNEARLHQHYERGIISSTERFSQTLGTWWQANEQITRCLLEEMAHVPVNPLHAMAHSGAAGGVRELRSLLAHGPHPTTAEGRLLDLPPLSSWMEGLGQWEYFLAALRVRRDRQIAAGRQRQIHALTHWLARRMTTLAGVRAALTVGRATERLSELLFTYGIGGILSIRAKPIRSVPLAQSRVVELFTRKEPGSPTERLTELKDIFDRDDVPVALSDLELVLHELAKPKGFLARASHGDVRAILFRAALANRSDPLERPREKTLLGRLLADDADDTNE